ncbi:hypothetical protein CH267_00410 [Rhodococcus sp. 06-621-2]|nr:nuclear transport factor 2 family protein [Rhodococcus sp. 06-621-2]OZC62848.1 hypothetical protein CH267_00410 [Rhodococcus sp. 06-621-2]
MSDLESRLAALESEVTDLRDREAIRDVLHRYCRGADRLDAEAMKSCYHEDAYDTHWFSNGPAQEFSEWVIADCLPAAHTTVHTLTNEIIEIEGDRAFVESHVHVLHEMAAPGDDPQKPFVHQLMECRYVDLFEKRDGQWKISYRHVVVDNNLELRVPEMPVLIPESMGKRSKEDPAYAGFDLEKLRPADFRTNFFEVGIAQDIPAK